MYKLTAAWGGRDRKKATAPTERWSGRQWKEQAEHDKVISAFDRAKRRMYKRLERAGNLSGERAKKDMTYEEYYDWLTAARTVREDYLAGKITAEQALVVIGADPLEDTVQ